MVCRDRNRLAMQSDILGASALGMRNMLCLTGDHQKFGDHPGCKKVFDLDSVQLLAMVKTMRDEGRFQGGEEITVPPQMFIGASENPFAEPYAFRVLRLAKKIVPARTLSRPSAYTIWNASAPGSNRPWTWG